MRIAAGDWAAQLRPAAGGAIAKLTRRGAHILRPTPAGAAGPLDYACFPLVPYANRIADGTFEFAGQPYRLACNHAGQAHPLHGLGWLSRWTVAASDATGMTLVHVHDGDAAWPFRYVATQVLSLDPGGLHATLTIVSLDERPQPISLGFHPYFVRHRQTTLAFGADGVWLTDAALIPTRHVAPDTLGDWSHGRSLTRTDLVDHCYTAWDGAATITRTDGAVTLSGIGTPLLHLYVPPDTSYFCAEPVTAMPDAVNRGDSTILHPGERHTIAMAIRG